MFNENNPWGPFSNMTVAVKNLLIINGLAFLATFLLGFQNIDVNGMLGLYYFDSPKFHVYQFITYMFLHDGLLHIFFNMFALVMFGSILENRLGTAKFLVYYFITGLGSGLLFMLTQAIQLQIITGGMMHDLNTLMVDNEDLMRVASIYFVPCVGASGAIFGLLVAFGFLYPNAQLGLLFVPIPVKAKYFILGYIAIELFMGLRQAPWDNVAHFAHLGGALTGIIILLIWQKQGKLWR